MHQPARRAKHALTVLTRLGDREQDLFEWLHRLVMSDPATMLPVALEVATESGDPLPTSPNAITLVISAVLQEVILPTATLLELRDAIHPHSNALAEAHALINLQLLHKGRETTSEVKVGAQAEFAERLLEVGGDSKHAYKIIRSARRKAWRKHLMMTALGIEILRIQAACEMHTGKFRRAVRTSQLAVRRVVRSSNRDAIPPSEVVRALVSLGMRYAAWKRNEDAKSVYGEAISLGDDLIEAFSRGAALTFASDLEEAGSEARAEEVLGLYRRVREASTEGVAMASVGMAELLVEEHSSRALSFAQRGFEHYERSYEGHREEARFHFAKTVMVSPEAVELAGTLTDEQRDFASRVTAIHEWALMELLKALIPRSQLGDIGGLLFKLRQLHEDDTDEARLAFADELNMLGLAARNGQRPYAAMIILSQAVDLSSNPQPETWWSLLRQSSHYASLSQAMDDARLPEAVEYARIACDIAEKALQRVTAIQEPDVSGIQSCSLALTAQYNGYSIRLENAGHLREAIAAQLRSVQEQAYIFDPSRPDHVWGAVVGTYRLLELAGESGSLNKVPRAQIDFARHVMDNYPGHKEDLTEVLAALRVRVREYEELDA